jgi:hypothetical protein
VERAPEGREPTRHTGRDVIVRAPRPTSHFTQVRNDVARDRELSYKARGLLITMLSYPDYWRFRIDDLVKGSPDGRHAVTTGLKELEQRGYLKRRATRLPDGTFSSRLIVFDVPNGTNPDADGDELLEAALVHDDGGNLWTSAATVSDYPRRVTGDLLEHSPKNNVQRGTRGTYNGNPRLCGKCKGSGRTAVHDEIADCHSCGGAGIR